MTHEIIISMLFFKTKLFQFMIETGMREYYSYKHYYRFMFVRRLASLYGYDNISSVFVEPVKGQPTIKMIVEL